MCVRVCVLSFHVYLFVYALLASIGSFRALLLFWCLSSCSLIASCLLLCYVRPITALPRATFVPDPVVIKTQKMCVCVFACVYVCVLVGTYLQQLLATQVAAIAESYLCPKGS